MAVIQKCTFCGSAISQGTGKLFVRKDAKLIWLCGMKCEKNMNKLGRKDRETRWTEAYKGEKKARMAAEAHQHTHVEAAKTAAPTKTNTKAGKKVKA